MKYAFLFAAGAALALGACSKTEDAAPEAGASAAATEAAAPAAAAAGDAPTKEFLAGTWGEGDACELPINFQADGTIKDGPFAKWELKDGELTMDNMVKLKLKVVDDKTMESTDEGNAEPTILKRCG